MSRNIPDPQVESLALQVAGKASKNLSDALSGSVSLRLLDASVKAAMSGGLDPAKYRGPWDAAANDPELPAAAEHEGDWYVVRTAGDGHLRGDRIVSDGTGWRPMPAPETSVGGVFYEDQAFHDEKEITFALVDADDYVCFAIYADGSVFPQYLTQPEVEALIPEIPEVPGYPVYLEEAFHNEKEILIAIVDADDYVTFAQYEDGTLYIAQTEDAGGGGGGTIGGNDPRLVSDTVYVGGKDLLFGVESADGQIAFGVMSDGSIANPHIKHIGKEITRGVEQVDRDRLSDLMRSPSTFALTPLMGQSNARRGESTPNDNPSTDNGLVFQNGGFLVGSSTIAAGAPPATNETGITGGLVPYDNSFLANIGGLKTAFNLQYALSSALGQPMAKHVLSVFAQDAVPIEQFAYASGYFCNFTTVLRYVRDQYAGRGNVICPYIYVDQGEYHDWQAHTDYDRRLETVRKAWSDAVQSILGQRFPVRFIISQVSNWTYYGAYNRYPYVAQKQWEMERDNPFIHISGPSYWATTIEGVHLDGRSQTIKGAYHAKAAHRVITLGQETGCLRPDTVTRTGNTITITVKGRVGALRAAPLWGGVKPHWGFELRGTAAQITGISLVDPRNRHDQWAYPVPSAIQIVTDVPASESSALVAYAFTGVEAGHIGLGNSSGPHGNICDSDPITMTLTNNGNEVVSLPNWLIHFSQPINHS